jgi:predicted alpha/beta hydrolase
VDDHLRKDVPAVLEYVLQATGAQQLHWIGHSMVSACERVCCERQAWDARSHLH